MATHKATIAGLQNDRQYGVRVFPRSPNGWQTSPDAFGFCTPMQFSRILAENSWAQIDAASRAGLAPTLWKVGDEKNITLTTGELLTLQIYGFNHDVLTGGGKAGITFGLKNLMAETRQMNSTNSNIGGITGSEMFSWFVNTLFYQLPPDLQAVIKPVNKRTSAGGSSSTINTNTMKLFLFSEIECFGLVRFSVVGEGSKYAIFSSDASRIKYNPIGTGFDHFWWQRSPTANITNCFPAVNSQGGNNYDPVGSYYGVCFGFCV